MCFFLGLKIIIGCIRCECFCIWRGIGVVVIRGLEGLEEFLKMYCKKLKFVFVKLSFRGKFEKYRRVSVSFYYISILR